MYPAGKKFGLALLCLLLAGLAIFLIIKKESPKEALQKLAFKTDGTQQILKEENTSNAPSVEAFLSGVEGEKRDSPNPVKESPDLYVPTKNDKMRAPTISSISNPRFGNTDTVTIYGENFTDDNTVLVSIEFDDAFIHIPSKNNGTSITFKADLSLSKAMAEDFWRLTEEQHKEVVRHIIATNSTDPTGWYIDASVAISNENGSSAPFPVKINITKGI